MGMVHVGRIPCNTPSHVMWWIHTAEYTGESFRTPLENALERSKSGSKNGNLCFFDLARISFSALTDMRSRD
jgi:hypothetical protein